MSDATPGTDLATTNGATGDPPPPPDYEGDDDRQGIWTADDGFVADGG